MEAAMLHEGLIRMHAQATSVQRSMPCLLCVCLLPSPRLPLHLPYTAR